LPAAREGHGPLPGTSPQLAEHEQCPKAERPRPITCTRQESAPAFAATSLKVCSAVPLKLQRSQLKALPRRIPAAAPPSGCRAAVPSSCAGPPAADAVTSRATRVSTRAATGHLKTPSGPPRRQRTSPPVAEQLCPPAAEKVSSGRPRPVPSRGSDPATFPLPAQFSAAAEPVHSCREVPSGLHRRCRQLPRSSPPCRVLYATCRGLTRGCATPHAARSTYRAAKFVSFTSRPSAAQRYLQLPQVTYGCSDSLYPAAETSISAQTYNQLQRRALRLQRVNQA